MSEKPRPVTRPWNRYPMGTIAHALNGGHWERVPGGWKWCTGDTFPRPGGDAFAVTLPDQGPMPAPEE